MFKLFALVSLALSSLQISATPVTSSSASPSGLDAKFKAKGKKFWGTASDSNIFSNPAAAAVIASEFGQLTAMNTMTWDFTEKTRGTFTFTGADALVEFAVSNGKLVRGHALVWQSQLPRWVITTTDADTLTSVIQNHIATVAGRYKGKIYGAEVLNDDGSFRASVFYNVLGESFITTAYAAARAADPDAALYINDFNLNSNNAKTQALVSLVNRINLAERYIDGIGTEMHLSAGGGLNATESLAALASTGLEVAITELDIVGASVEDYTTVVQACLDLPKCVSITSWGVSDSESWRPAATPLLFDAQYQPKDAYNAIISAL